MILYDIKKQNKTGLTDKYWWKQKENQQSTVVGCYCLRLWVLLLLQKKSVVFISLIFIFE